MVQWSRLGLMIALFSAGLLISASQASAQLTPEDLADFVSFSDAQAFLESASCKDIDAARRASDAKQKDDPLAFSSFCVMGAPELTEREASRRLGRRPLRIFVEKDIVTVLARPQSKTGPPSLCCAIQEPLKQIGTGSVWGGQYRVDKIDDAILPVWIGSMDTQTEFRGKRARKAPKASSKSTIMKGYSEHQVINPQSGISRTVTVHTPPGLKEGERYGVLYLTDAGTYSFALIVDKAIRQKRIPPVFLISSDSNEHRMEEYIPNRTTRYAEHFHFFTKEMPAWAEKNFPVSSRSQDRLVAGTSNGADFVLAAGSAPGRPFGTVIAMSPAFAPKAPAQCGETSKTNFYVSGGYYEMGFLRSASLSARRLEAAGCPTRYTAYHAGHDVSQWNIAFMDALEEHFAKAAE